MRQIKLIWDFRGPDAKNIAKHHSIHLKEYIKIEKLTDCFSGVEDINELHAIAFMIIYEDKMKFFRDALKPHRAVLHKAQNEA
ncbi:hypothetical protein MHTCC0001_11220 [Flavobacteriaceae bacterium MHTCC 0001]